MLQAQIKRKDGDTLPRVHDPATRSDECQPRFRNISIIA